MAIYDSSRGGYRVFVGDLGHRIGKNDLEREFERFGPVTDVWVARNPPGFGFVVYKYGEDAERAVKDLHGRNVCGRRVRVEHAHKAGSKRENRPPVPSRYDSGYNKRSRSPSGSRRRERRRSPSRSRSRSDERRSCGGDGDKRRGEERSSRRRSPSRSVTPDNSRKRSSRRDSVSRSRSASPPPQRSKRSRSYSRSD